MALYYEFGGATAGLDLFDEWSCKGNKYQGRADLEKKWDSFDGHTGVPVTIGTIRKLAVDNGADLEVLFEEFFEPIEDVHDIAGVVAQIIAQAQADAVAEGEEHDWAKYSLRGMSAQFEAEMQEQVFVLGNIALLGQWTVVYAGPNKGKTLLVLWQAIQAIKARAIDPDQLFYINADDHHQGLTTKLKLAERYGFHMLAPGYNEFRAKDFLDHLRKLCRKGQAKGTIVILDTMKKFTDLMEKRTASGFVMSSGSLSPRVAP